MLVVKDSSIKHAGFGVVANKSNKKGQTVCYYDGADVPCIWGVFDAYCICKYVVICTLENYII